MSTQLDWALDELDQRRAEDAMFPTEPDRDAPEWHAFAQMKFRRAQRRKRQGYSRATADGLVAWAIQREGGR